jgi:hypothetical protein
VEVSAVIHPVDEVLLDGGFKWAGHVCWFTILLGFARIYASKFTV